MTFTAQEAEYWHQRIQTAKVEKELLNERKKALTAQYQSLNHDNPEEEKQANIIWHEINLISNVIESLHLFASAAQRAGWEKEIYV